MKTIKPFRLSCLTRPYQFATRHYLGITVPILWDFQEGKPIAEGEQALWQLFKDESMDVFGAETLDLGIPKQQAEFILNAYAYSQYAKKGRTAVEVQLNNVKKSLWVTGDRYWVNNQATEPLPFDQIAISWRNAYGGEQFPHNVVGKGHKPQNFNGSKVQFLPNIEDPKNPVRYETSTYEAVGFGAIPLEYPNRHLMMGTYDKAWRTQDYPGFARDLNWHYFNQSPPDQYLGSLKPGDTIRFTHMHPEKPELKASVPDWVVRAFVKTVESGASVKGCLNPIDFALTTVWAYPHREQAILLYQANLEINSDDADELSHIMFALEHPLRTKPLSYYEQVFAQRTDSKLGTLYAALDKQLLDPEYMRPLAIEQLAISVQLKNKMKKLDRELEQTQVKLDEIKRDADQLDESDSEVKTFQTLKNKVISTTREDELAMSRKLLQGQLSFDELIEQQIESAKQNVDYSEKRQLLREQLKDLKQKQQSMSHAERATFFEDAEKDTHSQQVLAYQAKKMRDMGNYENEEQAQAAIDESNPALQELRKMEQAQYQQFDDLRRQYKMSKEKKGISQDISVVEEGAHLQEITSLHFFKDMPRDNLDGYVLVNAYAVQENYRALCIEPTFVCQSQFTQSDFSHAKLQHSRFKGVVFQSCDFTQADLSFSVFEDCHFIDCRMNSLSTNRLSLQRVEFNHCELNSWMHFKLFIKQVRFDQCKFESFNFFRSHTVDIVFEQCKIVRHSFVKGRLRQVQFLECEIESLALVGLRHVAGLHISDCHMEKVFIEAKTELSDMQMLHSLMKDSCWRELKLHQAKFIESDIGRNEFSKTEFHYAELKTVSAKDSLFMRSDFYSAKIDNADFSQTICKQASFKSTQLVHVSFFCAELAMIKTDHLTLQHDCWLERANVYPRIAA